MKLKTFAHEGVEYAVLSDGKPVYVGDDGKELAFDAPGTVATISRLNGEAKSNRERAERAEAAGKAFEGLDPAAARDAIDKLSRIDAKKLVESGDMDAAIQAAVKPHAEQAKAAEATIAKLTDTLNREVIGGSFGRSKFAADKLTPAGVDLIRTMYADRIKVEDGKPVGYDQNGQKMYSKARPGEIADFDEIVETFVDSYSFKDHILKGDIKSGGGAQQPGNPGGPKTLKQSQFDTLSAKDRAAKMADGYQIVEG